MKKTLIILINALLVVVLMLGSYASAGEEQKWPKSVRFAAGTGTSFYVIGAGLCKMIEKHLGVPGLPLVAAGWQSMYSMAAGDIDMAFVVAIADHDAPRGVGHFQKFGKVPVRAFLQTFPLEFLLVTLEKSGIKSWSDLKGKKVYAYIRGAVAHHQCFTTCLETHGLKESDLKAVIEYDRGPEGFDALNTGKCDALYVGGASPIAALQEMALTLPLRIIGMDDAKIEKAIKKLSKVWATRKITLPAGTYKGQNQEISIVGEAITIGCHRDLPDNFIYQVTKMVWENFNEFAAFHPVAKKFKAEDVREASIYPYHPGAIKYYKEVGVWDKALDKRQEALLRELGEKR